jgi:uncharacterized protein
MNIVRSAVIVLLISSSFANALPKPIGYVSDYIGLLSNKDLADIIGAVESIEASTGAEIAVIIQDSLGSYTLEELALAYLTEWKVGKKGEDNGLVLLLVVDESRQHGKYRFDTGLGLEDKLPDGLLGQIGREEMAPHFRNYDYGSGILSAVVRIGETLGADMSASRPKSQRTRGIPGIGIFILLILIFLLFGGRGGRRGAAGLGGSNLIWLMLLGSMGQRGGHGGWGGLGGGRGFGGGGFGGFGGGGGGAGGGASGSW